jgi:TldD protein
MPTNRRDFLRTTAAAAAVVGARAVTGAPITPAFAAPLVAPRADAFIEDLAMEALNAAKDAGASYADARIGRYRRQGINTRERQVTNVSDSESYGLGVRALVGGSWGFAATSTMTKEGVVAAAKEAARLARAARSVQRRPVELAPAPAVKGTWKTPTTRDPLDVPIEEKVALLLAANEAALKVPKVRFVNSGLQLLREEKTLATTDGTLVTQTFVRVFLPLSLPGVIGAGLLVFIFSLGFFITPAILGGGKTIMVAEYINVQIDESLRWGVGTMIASTLVATIFALMFALSRLVDLRSLFGAK